MTRSLAFMLFLLMACVTAQAQPTRMYKYAVFFRDKDSMAHRLSEPQTFLSPKALERKAAAGIAVDEKDLPVNPVYVQMLRDSGFDVHNTSKWFNCAVVFTEQKNAIPALGRLAGVEQVIEVGYSTVRKNKLQDVNLDEMVEALENKFVRNRRRIDTTGTIYGAGFIQADMIGVPGLHASGLDGSQTLVAVIDAGFSKASTHHVFANTLRNVVATYDFVDLEQNVFNDDDHGTAVWSCMGASDSFSFIGTAPGARYLLLRSEDALTEFPVEEFYWVAAAEFADSMGADLISTSLGYNEFSDHRFNYTQKQLNGKKAWISKAAAMASRKGMFVISSAGNEGDNDWKQVTFPSDAEEVLTVGAVDKNGRFAPFSSIGPTADKRIKPNVVAMGEGTAIASDLGNVRTGNGTSYSCPVLAGGVACLWPLLRSHSHAQIRTMLELSGSGYDKPDKYSGYGVPDLVLVKLFATAHHSDTLLQVRQLSDGSLHAAIYAERKQKIIFTLSDESGNTIMTQAVQVKQPGIGRLRINRPPKGFAGKCVVSVEFANTRFSQTIDWKS